MLIFLASSLVNMEGATGWDWRSNTPPGGRDWRAAISTPLAYRLFKPSFYNLFYFVPKNFNRKTEFLS